jgi:hypothetical protein
MIIYYFLYINETGFEFTTGRVDQNGTEPTMGRVTQNFILVR